MADTSDFRSRIEGDGDIEALRREVDELRDAVSKIQDTEPGDDVRIVAGEGATVDRLDGVWVIGADGAGGGGTWTGTAPLIADVQEISASPTSMRCRPLDGGAAQSVIVAAIELAGGTGRGSGPYRVVVWPMRARAAAIEEVSG